MLQLPCLDMPSWHVLLQLFRQSARAARGSITHFHTPFDVRPSSQDVKPSRKGETRDLGFRGTTEFCWSWGKHSSKGIAELVVRVIIHKCSNSTDIMWFRIQKKINLKNPIGRGKSFKQSQALRPGPY